MQDPYAPHARFVDAARQVTDLRMVVNVMATFLAVLFIAPYVVYALLPEGWGEAFSEGTTALGTLAQFSFFAVPAAGFLWALRRGHGRGLWTLIGPLAPAIYDLRKVFVAVLVILIFVGLLFPNGTEGGVAEVRNIALWLILIPFALIALIIQVGTEEMVFRGYLQQQFGSLSSDPRVWMILPSLIFGGLHYWNGNSFAEGFAYMIWAALLGVACADLTARTGTLGAAVGLHLATNFAAIMFVGIKGWPLSGLALVLYAYEDPDAISAEIAEVATIWIIFSVLMIALNVAIMWLAARIALRL